jgi:hypothetical protein
MTIDGADHAGHPDLRRLLRWEESGGTWKVAVRRRDNVTLTLTTCDGGEAMDAITSSDPELLAHVLDRPDARSR